MTNEQLLKKGKERIGYIDGIRGIASVMVVLCHLACVFLPELYFSAKATTSFSHFFLSSPFNIITNGNFAVQCFFVLSGFLIARKIYATESSLGDSLSPVKNYIKFVRIVYPAVLFSATLMLFGLMFHLKAAELNSQLSFVLDYNSFSPSFLSTFFTEPFIRVFLYKSVYVGPFWTIKYEFFGTVVISAISYFARDHVRIAKVFYLICWLLFVIICPNLTAFTIGAFVFDCVDRKETDTSMIGKIVRWILSKKVLIAVIGAAGIYLACVNIELTGLWEPFNSLIYYIQKIVSISIDPLVIRALGIGICLICIYECPFLHKVLEIRFLKWLGRISAYTYAFHWPIILSLGCGLYLLLANKLPYYVIVSIISISVFIVTLAMAFLYTKLLPHITNLEGMIFQKVQKSFHIKEKKARC